MSRATLHCGHVVDVLRALPAESVQCVVTSPPYWGLRDYGVPASVWGADPTCSHSWGDAPLVSIDNIDKRRWNHAENGRGEAQPESKRITRKGGTVSLGQTCSQCGAWFGALGLEPIPDLFVAHVVEVFEEVKRVLKRDGVLWLNMGDGYASAPHGHNGFGTSTLTKQGAYQAEKPYPNSAGPRVGRGSSFRRDRMPRQDEPHKSAPGLKPNLNPKYLELARQRIGPMLCDVVAA